MRLSKSFAMTAYFLAACFLFGPAAVAADPTAGQVVGLCSRDGTTDVVLEEMLRTEGVPFVRLRDVNQAIQSKLKALVLGQGFDDGDAARAFVEQGGVLMALKPSGRLAEALGLKHAGACENGYLTLDGRAASLTNYEGRLQLFGSSHRYEGGEHLARFSPDEASGAVVRVARGSGKALVVAFDLPATVLALQQPESDAGVASDASRVEYELADVPQADLIRRLLVGLLLDEIDVPLPRTWYFPAQHRAMMIPLGDQDGADFEQMKVVLELIKELQTPYTLYLTSENQPIGKDQLAALAQGGVELALHPDFVSGGQEFSEKELLAQLNKAVDDAGGPIIGQRPHCCRWGSIRDVPTWTERAGLQYEAILGLKTWESKPLKLGYWVGTGLPYRFIDPADGRRFDLLEIPVAGIDNHDFWKGPLQHVSYMPGGPKVPLVGLGLNEDEAFRRSKAFIDQAVDRFHAVYGYCWHPVYLSARRLNRAIEGPSDVHFRMCINYATSRGMGLIGSNALNDFWRARDKASITNIAWDEPSATMQYTVAAETSVEGLTLIAPYKVQGQRANVSIDGRRIACARADLLGSQYAMWTVDAGPKPTTVEVVYREPPPPEPVAAAAATDATAAEYRWELVTAKAAFAPRDGAGALVFDNRMWLLGGWNPRDKEHFPRICTNDVWSSSDGRDWTLVKPNTFCDASFDPAADWEGRHTAGYVVHDGRMWIVGGDPIQEHYQNDVWNSDDGKQWTRAADNVPWAPRVLHHTVAFDGKIWVMGGQTLPPFAPAAERFHRDIWNSADGRQWQKIEPQEPYWSARGMIGGTAVFKDRIWILGGGTYDTPKRPKRDLFNDVWSSADGVHWICHAPSAPWAPRQYHDVAVFDGRLWVLEGWNQENRNDVWYSADGADWRELPGTPWKPRHAASVFVHDGALWMVTGNNMESDVWKLVPVKDADASR